MTDTTGPRVPDALISALIAVESGGKDNAIGDSGMAVGCLQIHEILVKDVNRILGKGGLSKFDGPARWSRAHSIDMCRIYLAHYATAKRLGRQPTLEDMARIWNGGPNGWRDDLGAKSKNTAAYWRKVRAALEAELGNRVAPGDSVDGVTVDATAANIPWPEPTVNAAPPPYAEPEERAAWDRFAAAAFTNMEMNAAEAAKFADAMLYERRKRFTS